MSEVVTYDVRDSCARLTIERPEERNALSNSVLAGLRAATQRAAKDPQVRVVVLAGAGDRAFCAGGDLTEMSGPDQAFPGHTGRGQLAGLFEDLWDLGKPTIARVQGFALAGGCGLAAACDFVVASERAVFGVPEVKVGLWPYMITVPLLNSLPPKVVLQLMLTGRRVDAEEALRLGLATQVVPHEQLDLVVENLATELATGSSQAIALGRTAFYRALNADLALRSQMLQSMLTVNLSMPDAHEGLAAFKEKRSPSWNAEDGPT